MLIVQFCYYAATKCVQTDLKILTLEEKEMASSTAKVAVTRWFLSYRDFSTQSHSYLDLAITFKAFYASVKNSKLKKHNKLYMSRGGGG